MRESLLEMTQPESEGNLMRRAPAFMQGRRLAET